MDKALRFARANGAGPAIVLAFAAYVFLGLPDTLIGVAWPSIRTDFSLPLDSLGGLFMAMMIGYLTSSFFGGRIMSRLRLGVLLTASCVAGGIALIGYGAAPSWRAIMFLGVLAGLGVGATDMALNTYVVLNHGEGTMQWLHASYGLGATLGPLVMTTGISFFHTWRFGYFGVGGLQLVLALCFCLTVSLWERPNRAPKGMEKESRPKESDSSMRQTLCQTRVWLSMFLFFVCMGVEFTLASWTYTLLTESRGVSVSFAGVWMGSYYAIFSVGRIVAGLYAGRVSRNMLISGSLLVGLGAGLLLAWNPGTLASLGAATLLGFSIAPVMPGLMSGTADRVGAPFVRNAIGMQVAAQGVGAAVLSSLAGVVAQRLSLEAIPVYLIVLILVLGASYALSLRSGPVFAGKAEQSR